MPFTIMPTIVEETELRTHLKETLEDLPNNLPQYDEPRLLGDLCFLLRSPLFLYTISPRLTKPEARSTPAPPTPMSMASDTDKHDNAFHISHLEIRIRWHDESWAAQLLYGDNVLLEGRQLDIEQEVGFVQSFWWFCEEASFLAYEYKAREHAAAVRTGGASDSEPLRRDEDKLDGGWVAPSRSKGRDNRRALKLRIRFRDTVRGAAGVWVVV